MALCADYAWDLTIGSISATGYYAAFGAGQVIAAREACRAVVDKNTLQSDICYIKTTQFIAAHAAVFGAGATGAEYIASVEGQIEATKANTAESTKAKRDLSGLEAFNATDVKPQAIWTYDPAGEAARQYNMFNNTSAFDGWEADEVEKRQGGCASVYLPGDNGDWYNLPGATIKVTCNRGCASRIGLTWVEDLLDEIARRTLDDGVSDYSFIIRDSDSANIWSNCRVQVRYDPTDMCPSDLGQVCSVV